jgi:hypothetical protein
MTPVMLRTIESGDLGVVMNATVYGCVEDGSVAGRLVVVPVVLGPLI